jgi:hypothetical protein
VEEEVGQHHHHTVPTISRHRVAENALPNLVIRNLVGDGHGCFWMFPTKAR